MTSAEIAIEARILREQAKRHTIDTLVWQTIKSNHRKRTKLTTINQIFSFAGVPRSVLMDYTDLTDGGQRSRAVKKRGSN